MVGPHLTHRAEAREKVFPSALRVGRERREFQEGDSERRDVDFVLLCERDGSFPLRLRDQHRSHALRLLRRGEINERVTSV